MDDFSDIVIVGGGPVGAALALALSDSGLAVTLFEAREAAQRVSDSRPLALSYGSRLILERLGVWHALAPATPIDRIHVSQRGGFGRVVLSAAESGLPALGYVADYAQLHAALEDGLQRRGPRYFAGAKVLAVRDAQGTATVEFTAGGAPKTIGCRLVVAADGGALQGVAAVRTVDYHQVALTTRVRSELAHHNTAFERFTGDGPLALLPCGDELAVVWTARTERAQELYGLAPADFLIRLEHHFGGRLGSFSGGGARALFPLMLKHATEVLRPRVALIGNAAQTLHPVAGQGFNLGLRDAWELAGAILECRQEAIGDAAMLLAYQSRRRLDRRAGIWFTDSLVRLFSNDVAPLAAARGVGLALLGCVPPLKNFVVRRMTFGARG
ncbi:MAG: FAD-dependent oxidoreductase [Burkholderiales bacterium]